jgi:hypothetical protein
MNPGKHIVTSIRDYSTLRLNESLVSIKEISKLSKLILHITTLRLYDEFHHLESDKMVVSNIFSVIDLSPFTELRDFISSEFVNNIVLQFDRKTLNKAVYDIDSKSIIIYLSSKTIIDKTRQFKKDESDMYFSLSKIENTLQHELQHAYDDFRSGGKFLDKEHHRDIELRGSDLDPVVYLKQHLNLRHEITPRITTALNNTSFYKKDYEETPTSDMDGSVYVVYKILPFEKVKKDFIDKYDGWNHLSDTNRKSILHKLGKYYIDTESSLKEMNDKREMQYFN